MSYETVVLEYMETLQHLQMENYQVSLLAVYAVAAHEHLPQKHGMPNGRRLYVKHYIYVQTQLLFLFRTQPA